MAQRIKAVELGNHVIAVYPDRKSKFDDAFEFLRPGLERNEVVMLLTEDMTKDEVRERMRKEWNVDVADLEEKGDIIIVTQTEWYFPDVVPNTQRTIAMWKALAEQSIARGKRGVRVFGDTVAFFRHNLSKYLLDYETTLEREFNFPLAAICSYEAKDIENHYTKEEFQHLRDHHYPVWLFENQMKSV